MRAGPVRKSALVQVFGCRHDQPFHALWRPASKKRQGTKSREVWHWRCRGRYGDLIAAPGWRVDVTPRGCGRRSDVEECAGCRDVLGAVGGGKEPVVADTVETLDRFECGFDAERLQHAQ